MAGRTLSEAEREAADRARRQTVEQLHGQLADGIANLDDKDAWQRWLGMASKLYRYSFNNVILTMLQKPDATMVAGYRAWQAMGHQVRRGEKAIKILGPVTRKVELVDRATGEPIRDADGRPQYVRQLVGVRPVSVFDASQVDPPVESPPEPTLLRGQAPPGLWDSLAELVEAEGFQLTRGDCGGANGLTDYLGREVRVRADVDDAQAVKTLAHDLLTAPTGLFCLVGRSLCLGDTPPGFLLSLSFLVVCWAHRHGSTGRALWRRVWVRRDGT